jgi:hypothetical protein
MKPDVFITRLSTRKVAKIPFFFGHRVQGYEQIPDSLQSGFIRPDIQ